DGIRDFHVTGVQTCALPILFAREENLAIAYGMGITAEKVAEEWNVSREDQDAFALGSHRKALAAIERGEFREEITPLEVVAHLRSEERRGGKDGRARGGWEQ